MKGVWPDGHDGIQKLKKLALYRFSLCMVEQGNAHSSPYIQGTTLYLVIIYFLAQRTYNMHTTYIQPLMIITENAFPAQNTNILNVPAMYNSYTCIYILHKFIHVYKLLLYPCGIHIHTPVLTTSTCQGKYKYMYIHTRMSHIVYYTPKGGDSVGGGIKSDVAL